MLISFNTAINFLNLIYQPVHIEQKLYKYSNTCTKFVQNYMTDWFKYSQIKPFRIEAIKPQWLLTYSFVNIKKYTKMPFINKKSGY